MRESFLIRNFYVNGRNCSGHIDFCYSERSGCKTLMPIATASSQPCEALKNCRR